MSVNEYIFHSFYVPYFLKSRLLVEIGPTPRVHQCSWWRMGLHQESTKALGGDWAYTKSPPRLLVEIGPTPRVHQGSWWRMGLHKESTKALGGDWAYTKSPPRLLVENGPTPRVHQGSWWTFGGLFSGVLVSTKKIA